MSGYKLLIDYCPITANHHLPPPISTTCTTTFIKSSVILLTVGALICTSLSNLVPFDNYFDKECDKLERVTMVVEYDSFESMSHAERTTMCLSPIYSH